MEKSERILGQRKLYEFVIGGVTQSLSFPVGGGTDQSVQYFFASQVVSTDAATTLAGYLGAGYRYFEIELLQTAASTFVAGVGAFSIGSGPDTFSTLTSATNTFLTSHAHEMFIINVSSTSAASGVTLDHAAAQTLIQGDSNLANKFISRADKDSTYSTLKATTKRYWVAYSDPTTASGSTNLQDPIGKASSTATSPSDMVTAVRNALTAVPSTIQVAEFSLLCNRKDTCRSLIVSSVEAAAASRMVWANVIAVDFAMSTRVGLQTPIYSWVRATSTIFARSIRASASLLGVSLLLAALLLF